VGIIDILEISKLVNVLGVVASKLRNHVMQR
jgi:hypothetical protein